MWEGGGKGKKGGPAESLIYRYSMQCKGKGEKGERKRKKRVLLYRFGLCTRKFVQRIQEIGGVDSDGGGEATVTVGANVKGTVSWRLL